MIIQFPTLAIRPNVLLKDQVLPGHSHDDFDHLTIVKSGAMRVEVVTPDGKQGRRIVAAGVPTADSHTVDQSTFHVPKGWLHTIAGLADITEFWCVYMPRNEHGEMIEQHPAEADRAYYEWITCGGLMPGGC